MTLTNGDLFWVNLAHTYKCTSNVFLKMKLKMFVIYAYKCTNINT